MKKLNYLFSVVILLAVLVTVGCGGDDPSGPTAEEVVLEKFSKDWALSSAIFKDGTITDMDGLILTINSNFGYSTSGSVARDPHPFPSSGTWEFVTVIDDKDQSTFTIKRGDELEMNVTLSETDLNLSFMFTEGTHTDSGREESVEGSWSVSFIAQ